MFGIRTVKSGCREKEEYYTQDESLSVQSSRTQALSSKEKESSTQRSRDFTSRAALSVAQSQDEYYTNEQKPNQSQEQ